MKRKGMMLWQLSFYLAFSSAFLPVEAQEQGAPVLEEGTGVEENPASEESPSPQGKGDGTAGDASLKVIDGTGARKRVKAAGAPKAPTAARAAAPAAGIAPSEASSGAAPVGQATAMPKMAKHPRGRRAARQRRFGKPKANGPAKDTAAKEALPKVPLSPISPWNP